MKKIVLYLCIGMMLVASAGCGKKNQETPESSTTTVESQESVVSSEAMQESSSADKVIGLEDLQGMMDQLENSEWSGVDAAGNAYLVALAGGEISYVIKDEDGEEKYEGAYQIDEEGKLAFQEGVEDALKDVEFEMVLDGEDSYLKINDIFLTQDDVADYEERVKNLDIAALAAEYMSSGHCWLACMDNQVVVLFFDGQQLQLRYVSKDGDKIVSENVDANWSMKFEDFAFYDYSGKKLEDFTWEFEDEGELKVFTLTDDENQEMTFYELEKDSIEDGVELAEEYLQNKREIDDIEDLTTVLAGYEGVSIVDAFVAAGLNPAFDNRAIFAEAFDIENYKGTAEQNLFLLESMGGTIK